jgi:hypothetical protein
MYQQSATTICITNEEQPSRQPYYQWEQPLCCAPGNFDPLKIHPTVPLEN